MSVESQIFLIPLTLTLPEASRRGRKLKCLGETPRRAKRITMAKSKQQKKEMLENMKSKIKDSKSLIISVFNKLPVNQDQTLRSELRKENIKHAVVKKTLLKKSFSENKIKGLPENELQGNISLTAAGDEVMGAKILAKFAKDKEDFKIVGGLLDSIWVDTNKILELAKLPSQPEMLAKTVGTIKAPLNSFVNVLFGNVRGLINVLNAVKNQK